MTNWAAAVSGRLLLLLTIKTSPADRALFTCTHTQMRTNQLQFTTTSQSFNNLYLQTKQNVIWNTKQSCSSWQTVSAVINNTSNNFRWGDLIQQPQVSTLITFEQDDYTVKPISL